MKELKKKRVLSTTQTIVLSFLFAILVGALILMLPISSAEGKVTPFIDAVFTATTSVCVTGLVVVDTYAYWSTFGQIVILMLIQLGGLGVVTFTMTVLMITGRRITLKDRLLLEDAFNMDTMQGIIRFLRTVLKYTILVEGIGALLYMVSFVPEFGAKGIWYAVFTSISAFCNAGIDIIGPDSLMPYVNHIWINLVTMFLIIAGGIGFIVWRDVGQVLCRFRNREIPFKWIFQKLSLHSKLALVSTAVFVLGGAVLFFVLEYTNPETIGNLRLHEKVLASLFQSVTTRTAGFASIPQQGLRNSSVLVSMVLMFIGGSPVGTAGGVKTVTIAVLMLTALSTAKGSRYVTAFRRTIPLITIRKALAVTMISFIMLGIGTILFSVVQPGNFSDLAFEITSAIGTAGLSRGFTSSLNLAGKITICCYMYLGRVGPISMAIAFSFRGNKIVGVLPEERVTVG